MREMLIQLGCGAVLLWGMATGALMLFTDNSNVAAIGGIIVVAIVGWMLVTDKR